MKNLIKALAITFIVVGGLILINNNPTFAMDGLLSPQETNTNYQDSIVYTSTTRSAVNVSTKFSVDLYSNSQSEVAAEDITIKYDNTKLKFLGLSNLADGSEILDSEYTTTTPSAVRLIIISDGEYNVIKTNENLLKLNFQAVTTGCAVVYTGNCKISDGISTEKSLNSSEMGGCVINVRCDVDGDGQFTLLDVAIIARHLGEKDGDSPQYTMDLVPDGVIDKKDLEKAKECLLNNSNYNDH
jgi:hypothetical protein